jgi:hypothetical protein
MDKYEKEMIFVVNLNHDIKAKTAIGIVIPRYVIISP